ncbi:glycosyltransferase family 4 protein [Bordetella genomosp. 5]|uniref:Glycosyl transferase n=1 Tax=Bordetella genomosp. 5 TaxID=1395608 RepID=A0A261U2X8_9BORD|nr:glycosyltransferase family 4 protein [Bordetella genomosp. 5]OZI55203.1 glycosyl transferase [Bordetella genomosp. 5]
MKILQLNFEKGWRGGERQTLYCMRAFRKAGHEVEILCRAGGPLAQRATDEGFKVHAVRNVPGQLAFLARHGAGYDIVHSQTANTNTWAVLTRLFHRRPVVFSRRTSFVVEPKDEWKTGYKWRNVDLFVAISEMAASEPRRLGIEPVIIRSAVEPHEIDQANVAALVQEFALTGRRMLATSAALLHDKDPVTLVRAIGELARTRSDFVFLHFGAGGNREAEARAEVQRLGLQDVYRFAGFRKGVEDFYSVMDVFVMASLEEALGSSVLDAFLQRVPVVSTDAGGLKESLADGRGVLCAVGDYQAMAAGMARCLDDAAFRADVTERAYAYVKTEHDVTEMGRRYLAHFDRLLAAKPRR